MVHDSVEDIFRGKFNISAAKKTEHKLHIVLTFSEISDGLPTWYIAVDIHLLWNAKSHCCHHKIIPLDRAS